MFLASLTLLVWIEILNTNLSLIYFYEISGKLWSQGKPPPGCLLAWQLIGTAVESFHWACETVYKKKSHSQSEKSTKSVDFFDCTNFVANLLMVKLEFWRSKYAHPAIYIECTRACVIHTVLTREAGMLASPRLIGNSLKTIKKLMFIRSKINCERNFRWKMCSGWFDSGQIILLALESKNWRRIHLLSLSQSIYKFNCCNSRLDRCCTTGIRK